MRIPPGIVWFHILQTHVAVGDVSYAVAMQVIVIVCPTRFEANELRRVLKRADGISSAQVRIVVVGVGPGCVHTAQQSVRDADWVILSGVAGGLTDVCRAGTAWWVGEVRTMSGQVISQPWLPDGAAARLKPAAIVSTGQIVRDAEARRAVARKSGATIVDLESGSLSREAAKHDCRFSIVKGISDDLSTTLPATIDQWLRADGSTRLLAVARSVLTGKTSFRELVVMRRSARLAIEQAAGLLDPWLRRDGE